MGKGQKTPEVQAIAGAGKGGVVPPASHRFKPGKSGNPAGRRKAGAVQREYLNAFVERRFSEKKLRRVFNRKGAPAAMRAAALRLIRQLESGDLSDFSGLLKGENNLEDLRGMGINTEVVKKFKQKTRRVPTGNDGETEEVIEREIELHDRSGTDFDRVTNHTDGQPKQDSNINVILRTPDDRASESAQVAERFRSLLKPGNN